ncbi:MAG TPA: Crp/Fnr family transcriptional regulator [Vicinamibacterales bacterium]
MTIEDDVKFLERVPFLRLVGRAGLRIIAIGAEQRYVHGGEVLFQRNTPADSGYLVQEGAFTVGNDGGAHGFNAGPGTLLAEMAMIAEVDYGVTARATVPSTVIRIPRVLFVKTLEGYPEAARRLREHIASLAEQSHRDLAHARTVIGGKVGGN